MTVMVAMIADLHDDAPVSATGLAEFDGVGHDAHARRRDRRAFLTVIIRCDRRPSTAEASQPLSRRTVRLSLPQHWSPHMTRPALIALATLGLAACGQGGGETAPSTPARPELTPEQRAAMLAALPSPWNQADLDNGRRVFARCRSCHTITEGGPNMTGPNLYGVFGRQAGAHPKYNYSTAVKQAGRHTGHAKCPLPHRPLI